MALNTIGSNRDQLIGLAIADREKLIDRDVLVGDPRRWRPRWFDGRFLAASDLQAEQNYFLVRQADLGRAGGSGVIDGLMVSEVLDPLTGMEKIRVEAGQGVTDTGELVVLFDKLDVSPTDVPEMRRLDAAFGLQVIPNESGGTRTGLYVLALRPVEWTAFPISAYPTSLTGTRTVEDGTVVEGVAVSLIPYPDYHEDENWNRRRARVAHEIFVKGRDYGLASGVLPLAMVALRGNLIEWVDSFLVRRETGAERPAGMDFGFGARALREAHLLQYQRHLADALNANHDQPFSATSFMDALPPVGQFPAASIDANSLTQRFFPAGIEVELSFVPEDELAAIIEESLLIPPIDLTTGTETLAGIGVVVLVPLSRADFAANLNALPNWDAELPRLRPVYTEIRSIASPRDLLLSRFLKPTPPTAPPPEEEAWRTLLRSGVKQNLLWYVRRRQIPIPANVAGIPVSADNVAVSDPSRLADLLAADPLLAERFEALRSVSIPEVSALLKRLSERRFLDKPALLKSLVLRAAGPSGAKLDPKGTLAALSPVADPGLGEGLSQIEARSTTLVRSLYSERIVSTGLLPDVDVLARDIPPERFDDFLEALKAAIRSGEKIAGNLAVLREKFTT